MPYLLQGFSVIPPQRLLQDGAYTAPNATGYFLITPTVEMLVGRLALA